VADLRDVPRSTATDRIETFLDRFELREDASKRIGSYSKGMKRKTAFVQSVLHEPDVLFLDEPTSGLDPRAARRIRESITDFADDGTTVFLSTHILPVVEAVADTVGVLFEGTLVAEGSPSRYSFSAVTSSSRSRRLTSRARPSAPPPPSPTSVRRGCSFRSPSSSCRRSGRWSDWAASTARTAS
jgi:ABC-2 type transport system ATP-binding protein